MISCFWYFIWTNYCLIAIIYAFYVILKAIIHLHLFLLSQKKYIIIIGPYEIRFISKFDFNK